jgi:hypothetical protein
VREHVPGGQSTRDTYARPTSPRRSSGTPTTAAAVTPGSRAMTCSTSAGYTLKPPLMYMSVNRSVIVR